MGSLKLAFQRKKDGLPNYKRRLCCPHTPYQSHKYGVLVALIRRTYDAFTPYLHCLYVVIRSSLRRN